MKARSVCATPVANPPDPCGKVGRFHQTLRRHLANAGPFQTKRQLQDALDSLVEQYNTTRPHHSLGLRTPIEASTRG